MTPNEPLCAEQLCRNCYECGRNIQPLEAWVEDDGKYYCEDCNELYRKDEEDDGAK